MKRRNFLFTLLRTLVADPVEAFGAAVDDIKAQRSRSLGFGRGDPATEAQRAADRRRAIRDAMKGEEPLPCASQAPA
jgi:hypothetical protein